MLYMLYVRVYVYIYICMMCSRPGSSPKKTIHRTYKY